MKGKKILSRALTIIIIFLALVCLILFFKIITKSDISLFGCRFYYVVTESMFPTIKPNSLMLVKRVDTESLEVNDIISFVSRDEDIYGMVNTHRIVDIIEENGTTAFVTMGDNNPAPDDLHVFPDEIKGKVILWTPPMKGLTEFLQFSGTKMGFIIVILIPLMLVMGMFMRSFIKEFKRSIDLEEALVKELYEKEKPVSEDEKKTAAIQILEMYFGKKLSEITMDDIEAALNKAE